MSIPCTTCAGKPSFAAFIPSWEGTRTRWVWLMYPPRPSTSLNYIPRPSRAPVVLGADAWKSEVSQNWDQKRHGRPWVSHSKSAILKWLITHIGWFPPQFPHCQCTQFTRLSRSPRSSGAFRTAAGLTEKCVRNIVTQQSRASQT